MMKTAWIIGASSGIGHHLALQLARDGYAVALSARRQNALKKVAADLADSSQTYILPLDVMDLASIESARDRLLEQAGTIDLVVFAAGIYTPMPLEEFDLETSLQTLDVNLNGAFRVYHALKDFMQDPLTPFHMAWVASVAGYRGLPGAAAYGASKAALINFAEIQRSEMGEHNTKIQVINPGFVKSQLTDKNTFEMPMMISPEKAATYIIKGLHKDKFEIAFPPLFVFFMKLLRLMPYSLFFKVMQKVAKDQRSSQND